MKTTFTLQLLFLTWAWALSQPPEATSLSVYVWEFAAQNVKEDARHQVDLLTNDFETEMTQSGLYEVLEIRERSRLDEQRALQDIIFNIEELSEADRQTLQEKQAEAVFFGKLIYNERSRENILEVKLQHLDGRILRKGSIYLNPSDLIMNDSRRAIVKRLFMAVHEDIYAAQRQALHQRRKVQYDLITEKLNQFVRRTEDLTTQFRRLDFQLLNQAYINEYSQAILRYNEVITDIKEQQDQYLSDFGAVWGTDFGRQLTDVLDQVIDFHDQYILNTLNRRNEEISRYQLAKNKKARQALQAELERDRRTFTETMNDAWPVLKAAVELFLHDARRQLNITEQRSESNHP